MQKALQAKRVWLNPKYRSIFHPPIRAVARTKPSHEKEDITPPPAPSRPAVSMQVSLPHGHPICYPSNPFNPPPAPNGVTELSH